MAPRALALALALASAAAAEAAAAAPGTPPAAGAPAARRGAELVVANAERGLALRIPLAPGETFSVTSQHSIYEQPVTEEFAVDGEGRIVLQAVSSPSAAVREYFGLTGAGERQRVVRVLPEIVFRIAAGAPQRLRAGGVERSFLELGEHGDRLVMRAHPS